MLDLVLLSQEAIYHKLFVRNREPFSTENSVLMAVLTWWLQLPRSYVHGPYYPCMIWLKRKFSAHEVEVGNRNAVTLKASVRTHRYREV